MLDSTVIKSHSSPRCTVDPQRLHGGSSIKWGVPWDSLARLIAFVDNLWGWPPLATFASTQRQRNSAWLEFQPSSCATAALMLLRIWIACLNRGFVIQIVQSKRLDQFTSCLFRKANKIDTEGNVGNLPFWVDVDPPATPKKPKQKTFIPPDARD